MSRRQFNAPVHGMRPSRVSAIPAPFIAKRRRTRAAFTVPAPPGFAAAPGPGHGLYGRQGSNLAIASTMWAGLPQSIILFAIIPSQFAAQISSKFHGTFFRNLCCNNEKHSILPNAQGCSPVTPQSWQVRRVMRVSAQAPCCNTRGRMKAVKGGRVVFAIDHVRKQIPRQQDQKGVA